MEQLNRRQFLEKTGVISSCVTMGAPLWVKKENPGIFPGNISKRDLEVIRSQIRSKKAGHPSIHFNETRLKEIRHNARGTHRIYVDRLYRWMEKNVSWEPPEITGEQGNEVELEESGAFLTNVSLAFSISGKREYLEIARKWALKMCDYPNKAIRNYGIGIYVAGLARSYDWLYHDLPVSDRDVIKDSISHILMRMYTDAQPGAENPFWWARSYIHHDFCIPMGGFGEASLAMLGELEDADKYAAFARLNFDILMSWIGEDGSWHEGVADWCYAMAPMLWFYGAWESTVGENLMDTPWMRNTATYRLYHWLPDNHYVNLNDSFRSGRYSTSGSASSHLLRRLASVFRDGYAQWLADQDEEFDQKPSPKGVYQAPYERLSYQFDPIEYPHPDSQTAAWNVLWYDPTIPPVPPGQLPRSKHFENLDIVIMRTGWSKNDTVVSFSCGPLSGHTLARRLRAGESISPSIYYHDHADHASFTIFANDQYVIIPPGYARRASGFQNVVSLNGADYNTDPSLDIRMEAFITEEDFTCAVGNGTEAFLPQLGIHSYKRYMVLLPDNWLIIFDDLRLSDTGMKNSIFNRFGWTVHSDPNTHRFDIDGNKVHWVSSSGDKPLRMFMLRPREYGWERSFFQSINGKPMLESLTLSKPEFYGASQQVLSAWTWDEAAGEPGCLDRQDMVVVLSGSEKAIGFAKKPGISDDLSGIDLGNRELVLFGSDKKNPGAFFRVKNGRVY